MNVIGSQYWCKSDGAVWPPNKTGKRNNNDNDNVECRSFNANRFDAIECINGAERQLFGQSDFGGPTEREGERE